MRGPTSRLDDVMNGDPAVSPRMFEGWSGLHPSIPWGCCHRVVLAPAAPCRIGGQPSAAVEFSQSDAEQLGQNAT